MKKELSKKPNRFRLLADRHGLLYDVAAAAVLLLAAFALPFAGYTYKKVQYTVSGYDFLFGKAIAGGKVTVAPNTLILIAVIAAALILVTALLFGKIKKVRLGTTALTVLSLAAIVLIVMTTARLETLLDGAKKIKAVWGSGVAIALAALVLLRCLHILKLEGVLSWLDFMVLPGLAYVIINNYIPMFGMFIAFKKINYSVGIFKSPWVGLDNFRFLFSSSDAWIITRNTILYNIAFILLGLFTGIVIAICLFMVLKKGLQKFYQTTILLPQLISMVIVAYIVFAFLSNETGFVNKSLLSDEELINFYATKKYWPFLLIFINNWKMLGYNAVIFLSSICGIDRNLYEAATVDGAGTWKQITRITLPMLKPTIITLGLLLTGRIFYSDFGLFYQVPLDSGPLYAVTNTIDTYVYRSLLVLNNISLASAASFYQSVVGFIVVLAVNMIVRKVDRDNALL